MVSLVNSHTNATRIGWYLWEIDLRFAPVLPPGWFWDLKARPRPDGLLARIKPRGSSVFLFQGRVGTVEPFWAAIVELSRQPRRVGTVEPFCSRSDEVRVFRDSGLLLESREGVS